LAGVGRINNFNWTRYVCRKAKRGMWEHGELQETPSEYKKRYAVTANTKTWHLSNLGHPHMKTRCWLAVWCTAVWVITIKYEHLECRI
jgi:hypothetical protein